MKKRIVLAVLLVMPMGIVIAQSTGDKSKIRLALVEAETAAKKMTTATSTSAKNELKGTYRTVADKTISAIEALKKAVGEVTDPVALQQAAVKTRIAAEAIKFLLVAVRANDTARAAEKSKTVARALEEAANILHVQSADTAAERVQEAAVEIQRKDEAEYTGLLPF